MGTKKVKQLKNQIADDLGVLKGRINQIEDTTKAKIDVAKSEVDLKMSKTKLRVIEKKNSLEKKMEDFKNENKKIASTIKEGEIIF